MVQSDGYTRIVAVLLAALAGFVDAIGFIHSQGFFVSFMSGNSTRLGVGTVEGGSLAVTALLVIGAFVLGVAAGTFVSRAAPSHRHRPSVMLLVTAMLASGAASMSQEAPPLVTLCLIAAAMGSANVVLEAGGEVRIGVTYMTGALVRIGQGLGEMLGGRRDVAWLRWFPLWLGLAIGASAGAWTIHRMGASALWLAAVLSAALTLVLHIQPLNRAR